ncbi:MAG: hypothetical protein DI537_20455 [Stutzerimonas stutzeri]|nr:MAG: hypothetical protein DI537_20455 [Stutzerimonas stutzeri]
MSLEAVMTRVAEATEKNNDLLTALLASAAKGGVASAAATDTSGDEDGAGETASEPKKTRGRPAKDKTEDGAKSKGDGYEISFADLKAKFAAWLSEFAKAEDKDKPDGAHPEVAARKKALKDVLAKVSAEQLKDIESDAKKLTAVNKWFETKAKIDDHVGAGAGRFAADPSEDGDEGESDDLDL